MLTRSFLAFAIAASLASTVGGTGGCGATGGSEAGNPSRSVVGTLASLESVAALQTSASTQNSCPADEVVAVDSRKQLQSFPIATDCSFNLDLFFNKAYSIRFLLGDIEVGSMVFQNSPDRFPSPVMELSEQSPGVALGLIVLDDGQSKPENEPAAQSDADADGIPDFEDTDDDNDGILDVDEPDCDLDGIIDDYDAQNTNCKTAAPLPDNEVLEVLPRNGAGISSPSDAVLLNQAVQVRFSCELDLTSVNKDTFVIIAKDAPDNSLSCDLTILESGTTASCLPVGLVPDTEYKSAIRSLRCKDGNAIGTTEWTWRTAPVANAITDVTPPAEPEKLP